MKKRLFCFLSPLFLCGCSRLKEGELKEITRPYLGEYECKIARLGEVDLLDGLRFARIELNADNFRFVAREKDGKVRRYEGKYSYDETSGALRFFTPSLEGDKISSRLKKGEISILYPCGENTLFLFFTK